MVIGSRRSAFLARQGRPSFAPANLHRPQILPGLELRLFTPNDHPDPPSSPTPPDHPSQWHQSPLSCMLPQPPPGEEAQHSRSAKRNAKIHCSVATCADRKDTPSHFNPARRHSSWMARQNVRWIVHQPAVHDKIERFSSDQHDRTHIAHSSECQRRMHERQQTTVPHFFAWGLDPSHARTD